MDFEVDVLIEGGTVIDGTGEAGYVADLSIRDGVIQSVLRRDGADTGTGNVAPVRARQVIDATGLVVCPGFVDVHSHDDLALLHDGLLLNKVSQGVTTTIVGNCGLAPTPAASDPAAQAALRRYIEPVLGAWVDVKPGLFSEIREYMQAAEETALGQNVGVLVAHGSLRISVMGFSDAAPNEEQLRQMESLLERAMEAGALGMSLGLMYSPGCFAPMDELVRLGKVIARYDGIITSHIRGEGDLLISSIEEMIHLAQMSGARMHISHLKAVGIRNWGSVGRAIERIRDAVERGVDVTCDAYPYTAGSTTILSLMPPWAMEGGVDALLNRLADETTYARIRKDLLAPGDTWDNVAFLIGFDRIVLTSSTAPELAGFVGKSFANAAESLDLDAVDGYLRLVALGHGDGTIVVHHMHADDVREVLTFERTLVGSDGLPTIGGHPHPRLYGTFARYLGHYVRDEGILPFSEAVRRLTSASVDRFHLGTKRGRIDEGCAADVVILDVARLRDNATYESPREFADGVEAVLVAGEVVFSRGTATDKRPGSVLCRA